ncbi:hypothetical protein S40293_10324 [Stachybotrys chartarum IBT 40293]|nr:hypothetical protein S40293_10324 [Stachybotrys chartarum IBT 40293]
MLDPLGRFFIINDLGTNSILIIDAQDNLFEIIKTLCIEPAGCGPRHSVFYPASTPTTTHLFIIYELTNQVLAYLVTYIGSLLSFAKPEIALASNNIDLYMSNRLTGDPTNSL